MAPNTVPQVCVPDAELSGIHGKSQALAECLRLGPQFHLTLERESPNAFGGQFRFVALPRRHLDTDAGRRSRQTQNHEATDRENRIQQDAVPAERPNRATHQYQRTAGDGRNIQPVTNAPQQQAGRQAQC